MLCALILLAGYIYYFLMPVDVELIYIGDVLSGADDSISRDFVYFPQSIDDDILEEYIGHKPELLRELKQVDEDRYEVIVSFGKPIEKVTVIRYDLTRNTVRKGEVNKRTYIYAVEKSER